MFKIAKVINATRGRDSQHQPAWSIPRWSVEQLRLMRAGTAPRVSHPESRRRHFLLFVRAGSRSREPSTRVVELHLRSQASIKAELGHLRHTLSPHRCEAQPRPRFVHGVSISISAACATTGSRPSTTLLQFSCYTPSWSAQLHHRVLVPVESGLAVGIQIRRKEVVSSNGGFWSYCTSGPWRFR